MVTEDSVGGSRVLDLTRDLGDVARLGASVEAIDGLLRESLEALGEVIPFDLATVMELEDDQLVVRVATGPLDGPAVRRHRLKLADFPSIREVMRRGAARAFVDNDHADGDGDPFDGVLDLPHGHSCMVVPIRAAGRSMGVVTLDRQSCGAYPESVVNLADVFGKLLALVMCYGVQSERLERLSDQLTERNRLLQEAVHGTDSACDLIARAPSSAMQHVARLARQVAPTDTPALITGETGTGKEVLARAIHGWSRRADKPLVSINCASLPAGLIESELFGHVKGAFTGAARARVGRFFAANGGTLLLDEVGELPLDLQAKLLRVLQDGCFQPVGSDRSVRVDVRVLAATNRDLEQAIARREFREDLYYRLAVFPIHIPPLRVRKDDIATIARQTLARLAQRTGRGPWRLSDLDIAQLAARPWRGNVRELVNVLERATILSRDGRLDFAPGPAEPLQVTAETSGDVPPRLATLREVERDHIRRALARTSGRLYGAGGAAELLDIKPTTLSSRMKKLGLGSARDYR